VKDNDTSCRGWTDQMKRQIIIVTRREEKWDNFLLIIFHYHWEKRDDITHHMVLSLVTRETVIVMMVSRISFSPVITCPVCRWQLTREVVILFSLFLSCFVYFLLFLVLTSMLLTILSSFSPSICLAISSVSPSDAFLMTREHNTNCATKKGGQWAIPRQRDGRTIEGT